MKKKTRNRFVNNEVELNVMPFIDVFSLLCIFLLSSAVFLSVGTHRIQVPFLSNAPESANDKKDPLPKLVLSVSTKKIDLDIKESDKVPRKEAFQMNTDGLQRLHKFLLPIKESFPSLEKATVFFTDDVIYEDIVRVLDVLKLKDPHMTSDSKSRGQAQSALFSKIVFGSILD